jgi:hypothetical protein
MNSKFSYRQAFATVFISLILSACGGGGSEPPRASNAPTQQTLFSSNNTLSRYIGTWKTKCLNVLTSGPFKYGVETYKFGNPVGNKISIEFTQQTFTDSSCSASNASPNPTNFKDDYDFRGQVNVFATPEVTGTADKFDKPSLYSGTLIDYFAFQDNYQTLRNSGSLEPDSKRVIFSSLNALYSKQ